MKPVSALQPGADARHGEECRRAAANSEITPTAYTRRTTDLFMLVVFTDEKYG